MKEYLLRYQRHIILEGFGIEAQEKLSKANVLVIGMGGLGCPILQYLCAAGVGHIAIADHDVINLPNLNRQILYGTEDIGKFKVEVAAQKIQHLNDSVHITIFKDYWNQELSLKHFPTYDLVIDATDNFATRYLINDGCVLLSKPLVFGSVSKFEGQVSIFNVLKNGFAVNYRDLFPIPPKNSEVQSCAEGGVLGVLPGLIGVMQATEAIKWITGVGETLSNQLISYNALQQSFNKIDLIKHPQSSDALPKTAEAYLQTNYEWICQ